MKNVNDEGWMMKDDDFKMLMGFADKQTDGRTDICDCRVAFATEKNPIESIDLSLPNCICDTPKRSNDVYNWKENKSDYAGHEKNHL